MQHRGQSIGRYICKRGFQSQDVVHIFGELFVVGRTHQQGTVANVSLVGVNHRLVAGGIYQFIINETGLTQADLSTGSAN